MLLCIAQDESERTFVPSGTRMKQRHKKRRISTRALPSTKTQPAARRLAAQDRAALRSISESALFTLEASREMYADVRRLRPVLPNAKATLLEE